MSKDARPSLPSLTQLCDDRLSVATEARCVKDRNDPYQHAYNECVTARAAEKKARAAEKKARNDAFLVMVRCKERANLQARDKTRAEYLQQLRDCSKA